jgi:hypothetical protein
MKREKQERGQEATKENMEGRVTRGDKKERSNMERGGKDSKGQSEVEGCLGSPPHRKVEEDGISK